MDQQNLGEASDLISQGSSSSSNKGNHSLILQSRHSFCVLPETRAHQLPQCTCMHTHTYTVGLQISRRKGEDKEAKIMHLKNKVVTDIRTSF